MIINYGMLSTHPPTRCGLATFNSALADELIAGAGSGGVVRVTSGGDDERPLPGVVHTWSGGSAGGWRGGADALNSFDVAVIQHEYGIYPGADGADVLQLLHRLTRAEHRRAAHGAGSTQPRSESSCWSRSSPRRARW